MRWPDPTLEDTRHFMGSRPIPRQNVMPLWMFPVERRHEIHELVLEETPPAHWIDIHAGPHVIAQLPSRAWYEWYWYRNLNPLSPRDNLPRGMREAVIARDGLRCGLCGRDVHPADIHIDHIHPRSLGGRDELDNLQVTHAICNMRKGNRV